MLMLSMDPTLKNGTMDIRLYAQYGVSFEGIEKRLACLADVPYTIETKDLGRTGLDVVCFGQEHFDTISLLLNQREDKGSQDEQQDHLQELMKRQKLYSNVELFRKNVEDVIEMIERCLRYVNQVLNKEVTPNPEVGRQLNTTLTRFSKMDAESVFRLAQESYQDLLMISSLSKLTKTQVFISEKISSLFK